MTTKVTADGVCCMYSGSMWGEGEGEGRRGRGRGRGGEGVCLYIVSLRLVTAIIPITSQEPRT